MLFYNNLFKKLRESKCLTLEEIGKRIGISKQTVQKWESGAVKPRPGNVYEIAKVLDVSAVDISDLKPEKWLVEPKTPQISDIYETWRVGLISEIIKLDIDPEAKDIVLRIINCYEIKK